MSRSQPLLAGFTASAIGACLGAIALVAMLPHVGLGATPMWLATAGIAVAAVGFLVWLGARTCGPLSALARTMDALSRGEAVKVPATDRQDGIGQLARLVAAVAARSDDLRQAGAAARQEVATGHRKHDQDLLHILHDMVQLGTSSNEAVMQLARVKTEVAEADAHAQSMAAAVDELVASIAQISENSQHATTDAQDAAQAASQGSEASSQARTSMAEIVSAVEQAASEVDTLAQESAQIGEIVEEIENIAGQTNLLALNATIEAARAGDAGKGFAVVAGEVKTLANQTAKATVDIRGRIDHLRHRMDSIVAAIRHGADAVGEGRAVIDGLVGQLDTISERVHDATGKMSEIASILTQQTAAANDVAKGTGSIAQTASHNSRDIDGVLGALDALTNQLGEQIGQFADMDDDRALLEVSKNDHLVFAKKVVDVMTGRLDLRAADLVDHHHCRLGRWAGQASESLRASPTFQKLAEPHRQVHDHGRAALTAWHDGRHDVAMAEMERMMAASKEVIACLDQLSREIEDRQAAA